MFSFTAQVEVGSALKYPYLTWETNIRGTYTLLEAIRESNKKLNQPLSLHQIKHMETIL